MSAPEDLYKHQNPASREEVRSFNYAFSGSEVCCSLSARYHARRVRTKPTASCSRSSDVINDGDAAAAESKSSCKLWRERNAESRQRIMVLSDGRFLFITWRCREGVTSYLPRDLPREVPRGIYLVGARDKLFLYVCIYYA